MTTKKLFIYIIFSLWGLGGFAQNYQWQWAKAGGGENKLFADNIFGGIYDDINYHEEVVALKNTSDNHTYLLSHIAYGNTNFSGNSITTYHQPTSIDPWSNILLSKVDCEGNYLWHKVFGGGGNENRTRSMGIDTSDNVYVAMRVSNLGFHDSLANIVGSAFALPVHFDTDSIMDPIPRAWNGLALQNVNSPTHKKLALIKYNSQGQFQWLRMPQSDSLQYLTSRATDYGVTIEPNGTTHWLVGMGNGSHLDGTINISGLAQYEQQLYILKYDSNGNSLGYLPAPFNSNSEGYLPKKINFTYDPLTQQYYFTSWRDTNDSDEFVTIINNQEYRTSILICFNATGQVLWTKTANNTWSALVQGLLIDEQSNVYVSGIGTKKTILPNGSNGPEDGNFGGYQFNNQSGRQSFVIKFNAQGNLLWGSNADGIFIPGSGGSSSESTRSMTINGDELGVGTGFYNNTWGAFGITGQTVGAFSDPILIRLNKNTGVPVGGHRIQGPNGYREGLTAVETDKDGNYIVGGYMRTLIFGDGMGNNHPIIGQLNKANPGSNTDFFIAKLAKNTCNYLDTDTFTKLNLKVYPNPTTNNVFIDTPENLTTYEVYNILGQRLVSNSFNGDNSISLETFAPGTYFIKVTTGQNTQATVKVIKK
ncbi:T9SS type A sorting domain-containing protein [Flavobacterium sp. I3-2]|uniref:T9SS type A sorting domain-containing protein n=1 Tax=Flavobacterium sp. I3-2 TaxID=2748319 RepID=UPI0015B0A655|nr:T9SS type A sorting domain-containing protein [Flavobacterium sp. I3-2]